MKKKLLSILLVCAMAVATTACGGNAEEPAAPAETEAPAEETEAPAEDAGGAAEEQEAEAPASAEGKIAMITDSGDITDESFNQITWETVMAYGDTNGIEYEYYKPAEDTDEERINAIDLAIAEGATVVVMPGYLFGPAIAEEQDLYPEVTFIAVDVTEGDIVNLAGEQVPLGSNVYVCSFQEDSVVCSAAFYDGLSGRLCRCKRWLYRSWLLGRYCGSGCYPLRIWLRAGDRRCSGRDGR